MKKKFVAAHSIVSPLGFTSLDNFNQLKAGTSGIRFLTNSDYSPLPYWASQLNKQEVASQIGAASESYTYFEQLCILSILKAIETTQVDFSSDETLLILSTTKGNIELLTQNKFDSSRVYLHQSAKALQQFFNAKNTPIVISNACVSGVLALNVAASLLDSKRYSTIVVCGADTVCEFTISGFEAFKALSDGPCSPFDKNRNGTSLGEGAGCIVLSNKKETEFELLPGASSNDANHISGPSRDGEGLFIAIEKSLKANQSPSIDFISAHGTGTIFNDEMESKAFNRAGLQQVATNSLKGYYGHTFGAAGIIESVITLESMRHNLLIASKGFVEKSDNIQLSIITESCSHKINTALKTASGFGGCNATLLFQKTA